MRMPTTTIKAKKKWILWIRLLQLVWRMGNTLQDHVPEKILQRSNVDARGGTFFHCLHDVVHASHARYIAIRRIRKIAVR